jgi:hypothetical protein
MLTWNEALTQIKAWQSANPTQSKCFLITAADIANINTQAGNISALKMYLGQDSNGKVTAFFVGCVPDGNGGHNDYNIPSNQSAWNTAAGGGTLPLKKDGQPCPTACGSTNYLNS